MSNLSVSKVQRKTKHDPQPTLSENFNSHPLYVLVYFILYGKTSEFFNIKNSTTHPEAVTFSKHV
jgi:hypothetical protein